MKRTSWITWRTYLLSLPVDVVVLMFSADHKVESFSDTFSWAVIAVISHIALAPIVWLITYIYRSDMNWKFDLPNLVFMGAVRGFVITVLASKYNLELTVTPTYKILNSMLAVPQWFVAISIFVESRRRFQREFRSLFIKAMEVARNEKNQKRLLPGKISAGDEAIVKLQVLTDSLAQELQNLISRSGNLREYARHTEAIDSLIDSDLKPVSRKLWSAPSIIVPTIPLRQLIYFSILQSRLRVPEVVAMSMPYYFIGIHANANINTTLFQCILLALNDLVIFLTCELLHRMRFLSRKATNLLILFTVPIFGLLSQQLLVPDQFRILEGAFEFWSFELFMTVTFFLLVFTLNSYEIVTNHRSEIIEGLELLLSTENMEKAIGQNLQSIEDKNLAEYIHGEVQAGLIASSLLLQKAADSSDSELAQEALERAAGLLEQDHTSLYYTRMASPEAKLNKIIAGWQGIAEIHINMPEISKIEIGTLRNAVSLIEESINNSIRHASASVINVSGILKSDTLTVSIITDGEHFAKGRPGLGSKLFDELTEDWYTGREGDLTKIVFVLFNR